MEVDRSTAHRWKKAGLVEIITDEDRVLEVATPDNDAAEQADTSAKSKKAK